MRCDDIRPRLLDRQRGRLDAEEESALRAHVAECASCAHEEQAERLLTEALEHRLPQHPASPALKRRLAAAWLAPETPPARWRARLRGWAPALAAAAVVVVLVPFLVSAPALLRGRAGMGALVTEAVNDHLRVVSSEHPLDIASGGVHQVKPWFEGRLDFAPVVAFGGDADFPLQGGAIGWFIDRKAATFVFKRRLHAISLFVFRAEGLPWSARDAQRVGAVDVSSRTARGFNVLLWRNGDLGYALVSDVDSTELRELAERIIGPR